MSKEHQVHDDYTIFYIKRSDGNDPRYVQHKSLNFPYFWYRVPGAIPLNDTLANGLRVAIAPTGEGVVYMGGCTGSIAIEDVARGIRDVINEGRCGLNRSKVAFSTVQLGAEDRNKFISAMSELLKQQRGIDS